jgi:DNA repair exonuclease SbcCD ATPase subunit
MINVAVWAVLGVLVGWIVAWLLGSRMANNRLAAAQVDARTKQEQLKRDLETRLGRIENDLLGAKEMIQMRDAAIAERDKLIRQQTDQLTAGLSQLALATAERDDRQAKLSVQGQTFAAAEQDLRATRERLVEQEKSLAERDAQLTQLLPIPAKLALAEEELRAAKERFNSAQARVNSQDQEISRLHKRNVELEPLTVQAADRQTRMLALESRLAEAVRVRDGEIAQLKKRVAEFENLPARIDEAEVKRAKLVDELATLRRAKDEEIESLQDELRAIPPLRRELAARDQLYLSARALDVVSQRANDWAMAGFKAELAQRNAELDSKDSTIGGMHQQLAELAPLPNAVASHSAHALELARGLAQREMKLRSISDEAQSLRQSLLEWTRIAGALPARNAEIARLRTELQQSR